jgi:mono/diheme cytochrome c family protein
VRREIAGACLLVAVVAACSRRAATPAAKPTASSAGRAAGAGAPAAAPSPAVTPAPPVASYEVRIGQGVYQRYCETCHGTTGAGDGFNAFNLDPRPRDISDPAFQKKKTDADLTDAVQRGGAGVGLSALMPPWGRTLSKRELADVVLYVRTLARQPQAK